MAAYGTSKAVALPMQPWPTNDRSGEIIVNATAQSIAGQQDPRIVLLELLEEVAHGNKSAFARLYGLTHRKLLGVALRILRDHGLAEDVLQETYLKIWHRAASYNPAIASPMTWMATIVRHGAIDTLRKRQAEAFGTEDEMSAMAANEPDPIDEMDLAQIRPLALTAFARLPEDRRRMIVQAYLRDMSRQDLSTQLGIPANTVKTHLRRALLELRENMFASAAIRTRKAA